MGSIAEQEPSSGVERTDDGTDPGEATLASPPSGGPPSSRRGEPDGLGLRALLGRLAVGLAAICGAVVVLAVTLQEPLQAVSEAFVAAFGLGGVFVAVILTDTFALTHEPVLFAAHAGGLGFWPIFFTASVASVLAGILGWTLGGLLGRVPRVQALFARYRIDDFLQRYGGWAIAVAALTPFPFSVATWASGAARLPFRVVLFGSLFRVPKVMFYFLLIVGSWSLGTLGG